MESTWEQASDMMQVVSSATARKDSEISFRFILKRRLSRDTREMEMDFASEAVLRKTLSKQQLWKRRKLNFKFGSDGEFQ